MKLAVLQEKRQLISRDRQIAGIQRLNRIEGQINGLKKMLKASRPCVDILMQLASVQEAVRGMTKLMMRNYLENCATEAIRSRKGDEIYNELMDVIFKFSR